MATRIRSTTPDVSGGGGGPAPAGNVEWGPDFGEGAGNDDITFPAVVPSSDLESVDIAGNANITATMDLFAVDLDGNANVSSVADLEAVDLEGNIGIVTTADLESVDLEGGTSLTATMDLEAVDIEGGASVTSTVNGTVLGAPFYQNTTVTASTATGPTSTTIDVPSGTAAGKYVIILVGKTNLSDTVTITGFTKIRYSAGGQVDVTSFYKKLTGADSGTYTINYGHTPNGAICTAMLLDGVDQTTPVDASAGGSGNAVSPVVPSVTTTVANALKIAVCMQAQALTTTYTPPAGYEERSDQMSTQLGVVNGAGESCTRVQAATGASGTVTITSSQGLLSGDYATQHIAIAPGTVTIA